MKKILCYLLSVLMLFSTFGCDETSLNTTKATASPTTPDDFKVFSLDLGGLTDKELKSAIEEGVNGYCIDVTIDDVIFSIYGSELGITYNESLNLNDAVSRIRTKALTSEEIEENLLKIDTSVDIENALVEAYSSYLQYTIESAKEANAAAKEVSKAAETSKVANTDTTDTTDNTAVDVTKSNEASTTKESDASETIASENANSEAEAATETSEINTDDIQTMSEEELEKLEEKLEAIYDDTKAHIVYSKKEKKYIGEDGKEGDTTDYSSATTTLLDAAKKLETAVTLELGSKHVDGEKAEDSVEVQQAIKKANAYLDLEIIYNFNPPEGSGAESGKATINSKNIRNYIYIATNGRDIEIDTEALESYASSLSTKFSKVETKEEENDEDTVKITRTGIEVPYLTICENLETALSECKSQEFEAEYQTVDDTTIADKDDIYVLVDLSEQTVYLYEGGIVIYSTPCVSGRVSNGNYTRTGTYTIYSKETNRTLKGRTYSSFVKYWMPFNNNVGIHDASWRSSFGGDIYVYSGSHGCVNLSRKAAKYIYSKVKVGTKVIVTGGLTSVNGSTGTSTYSNSTTNNKKNDATTKATINTTSTETKNLETQTTQAQTTVSQTTQAQTTKAQTTQAQTTEAPTTQAQTTEAPTTQAQTTEEQTTEQP